MSRKLNVSLIWLVLIATSNSLGLTCSLQEPSGLRHNDPLSYAVTFARRSNNQSSLSRIAVHYAELGDFDQAMRLNESTTDEDWRTGAFADIALEYWKQGKKEKARELFLRVAGMPLPKDVIYIWGAVIEKMAQAEQFDLALDTAAAMAAAGGGTAGNALEKIVAEFTQARARNASLPDLLPKVIAIAGTLRDSGEVAGVIKKVAMAYTSRGEMQRAGKLIKDFKEDYDRDDVSHQLAIQFGKLGQYDRAVQLADKAGDYFREIALIEIGSEALRKGDKKKALEVAALLDSIIAKTMKHPGYESGGIDAQRLSELAVLYSQLDRRQRAVELANLAFQTAKAVGKPGDRYSSLRSAANTFSELGLYDLAIEATGALGDYDRIQFDVLAEVGRHAQSGGRVDVVAQIIKRMQSMSLKEHEELRVKTLVAIARAGAEQGRAKEAQTLLLSLKPFVAKIESNRETPKILKEYSVAFAEAGDVSQALKLIPGIEEPYFITDALIDIGLLSAKKGLSLTEENMKDIGEIADADLPPEIQPRRLTNEAGWEIPGFAQSRMLRPPELQRTRDRSIELYYTYYEPETEVFIPRPFESRRKRKPEEANWISEGLRVQLIEERTINGHKYCYRLRVDEIFHDQSTGMPKYTNDLETLLYYDEDGDGKFETLEEGLDYFARGHIPKWVLQK